MNEITLPYTTKAGESIAGIALRRLANETRWTEIRDLNADKFPDMLATDYYPVGTVINQPLPDPNNLSEDGEKLLKRLEAEANVRHHEDMIAKRQAEIQENINWWRKQEQIRIEGFNIAQTDPMYVRMNEQYNEQKLKEMLDV